MADNNIVSNEEDRLWKVVQNNPLAFNQWTALIGIIEKTNEIEKIRKVYSEFLNEFPLCFLYWKRFADHEFAHNNPTQSIEVFEKAVKAVTHSVDIWLNYCTHLIDKSYPVDEIRNVFKRGVDIIGKDYQSGKFWDKYIEFEMTQENNELASIFNSLLKTPLENLQIFNEKFKDNIDRIKINDMLTDDERKDYTGYDVETKQLILQNRDKWYHETLEKIAKRSNFESVVNKRFFFHIQPIDDMTLSVWRSYLNYMENDSTITSEEIIKLYERCLVPCCYYSEFWLKYVRYLETLGDNDNNIELIENVFKRATGIFLKKRSDIHLEYAEFVEAILGNIEKAGQILDNIYNQSPTHIETILRLVSFKIRNQSIQSANQFFKNVLLKFESENNSSNNSNNEDEEDNDDDNDNNTEKKQVSKLYPFLSVNYISFLLSNKKELKDEIKQGDVYEESRQVLKKSTSLYPHSKLLWLYYINFEFNILLFIDGGDDNNRKKQEQIDRIKKIYDDLLVDEDNSGVVCKLNSDDKLELWNNYLEFSQSYLNDIKTHRKLKKLFQSIYPDGKPESKKRSLIDMNATNGNSNNSSNNINSNNSNNDGPLSKRIAYSVPPSNDSPSSYNTYQQQSYSGGVGLYGQGYYSGGGYGY